MSKHEKRPYRSKQTLRILYHGEQLTSYEVANRLGCSQATVLRWMDRHDIETRQAATVKGKTSICVDEQGYERVWSSEEYVRLHRLLAVAEWGFEAVRDMNVHHKNEIKWDNRPENLEIMTHGEHTSHHKGD